MEKNNIKANAPPPPYEPAAADALPPPPAYGADLPPSY
jgi:hypothetical protein